MIRNPYANLAVQTVIGGVVMYLVMFVMIDRLSSFYNNLNMFYMTLMMVAPMVILIVILMAHMFPSKGMNVALVLGSLIAFVGAFAFIRAQVAIGDAAFLRSMIPHHSGAILMCEQADLKDERVLKLCERIIQSQKEEITELSALLSER